MSRITVVDRKSATPEQAALLEAIESQLGMVPNFLRVFAHSPAALRAFLGLHGIANEGLLDPQTKERIALAMAQQNTCQYCLSAHTAIGRKAGLDADEIQAARAGTSRDRKAAAAVKFAQALAEHKGDISNRELLEVREAGYSEAEVVEIITHVGMNILTNILGKASQVTIDFPVVDTKQVA